VQRRRTAASPYSVKVTSVKDRLVCPRVVFELNEKRRGRPSVLVGVLGSLGI